MQEDLDKNEDLNQGESITRVTGMYKDWFLDYASYVILERAVPSVEDGFKPVQRRIMQSMKDLDDLPKLPELPDPIDISPELALEVKSDQVDEKEV